MRKKYLSNIPRLGLVAMLSLLTCLTIHAQDPFDINCEIQVYNKQDNTFLKSATLWGSFNTLAKARQAMDDIHRQCDKASDVEATAKALQKKYNIVNPVSKIGKFTTTAVDGMAFLVMTPEDYEMSVFEIKNGKTNYVVRIDVKRIRTIVAKGRLREKDVIESGPVVDTGDGYEKFNIHIRQKAGIGRKSARLIVQPIAVDCQNDDTVGYCDPVVIEGKSYHKLQVKRMGYNYMKNDSLSRGYRNHYQFEDNEPIDQTFSVLYKKPNINRTYKGPSVISFEDYHHVYKRDEADGTCLRIRPFKFLDFTPALAGMELTEEFQQPALSTVSEYNQELNLSYDVGQAEYRRDSLNEMTLNKLVNELRSHGDYLMSINIEGAASPDGSVGLNTDLAQKRASNALSTIISRLGRHVPLPRPKVKVYTWEDVAAALATKGQKAAADSIYEITSQNKGDAADKFIGALPFYTSKIIPVLEGQRKMSCSYRVRLQHILTSTEAVQAYYDNKKLPQKERIRFSEGDYFNLLANVTDSTEQDSITVQAYNFLKSQVDFPYKKLSPYVANRMAIINLKRGTPDPRVLEPFIDFTMGIDRPKVIDEIVTVKVNRHEIMMNQAVTYYQDQKMDTAQYFINKLKAANMSSENISKLETFMNLRRYYGRTNLTAEEQRALIAAKNYVLNSGNENKAILYTEIPEWDEKEQAEDYVDMLNDNDAKKWYLKGLIWSRKVDKQTELFNEENTEDSTAFHKLSDEELEKIPVEKQNEYYNKLAKYEAEHKDDKPQEETEQTDLSRKPFYLAYFQHSFDMMPTYIRFYYMEGHIEDAQRKRYKYKNADIPTYRMMFERLKVMDNARKEELQKKAEELNVEDEVVEPNSTTNKEPNKAQ